MPLRADLLNPIPGDNPSGANLRYDPVYDKIKEARREDDEGDQGEWQTARKIADYAQVIKLASDAIAKKSKDLQLVAWLVEAHIRREGLNVVGDCFKFIHGFIDQFWDTFYPEMEDGEVDLRAGPLIWIGNKLDIPIKLAPITQSGFSYATYQESRKIGTEANADTYEKQQARNAAIAAGKITAEQFDEAVEATSMGFYATALSSVNTALSEIAAIQEFCEDKFASLGDEAPSFTDSKKALEDVGHQLEIFLRRKGGAVPVAAAEEEDEEPVAEPAATSAGRSAFSDDVSFAFDSSPTPAAVAEADPLGLDDDAPAPVAAEPQSEDDVVQQLSNICKYLRSADPQDVSPYLVLRAYRWGKLRTNTPPLSAEALIPPPTELRVKLKTLYKNGEWTSLLDATEEALGQPCAGAWIDLHRYAVVALEQNGLTPMATAIKTELRGLLHDLPDLKSATLMDDTSALSAETAAWIESDVLIDGAAGFSPSLNGTGANSGSSSDSGSNDWLSTRDSKFVLDPSSKAADPNYKPDSDSDSDSSSDSSFDVGSTDTDTSSSDTSSSDDSALSLDLGSDTSSDTPADAPAEAAAMEFPAIDENPPIIAELPPDIIDDNRDLFEIARDRVKSGNQAEGLKLITEKLANEKSNRGRFRRRTQIAHLLMDGGHPKVAEPLLEQLANEIETRRLDDWEEGEVIAYPLELLLRCVASESAQTEKRDELYSRLCKLDPVRAMAITV